MIPIGIEITGPHSARSWKYAGQPAPSRAERSGALGWVQVALSRRSRLYVIEKELFFKENEHRTHDTNLEQARCGTFFTYANW